MTIEPYAEPELVDERGAREFIGGSNSPISRATLHRGISNGRYPKPIKVGPGSNRFLMSELKALRASLIAKRELGKVL